MSRGSVGDTDVDAVGLLKKLTALQIPGGPKRNSPSNSSDEQEKNDKQQEQDATEEGDMPDWYEELDDDQSSAFKELFDMLDCSNTGTLNADSLYAGLRKIDSEISRADVESVINTLDDDGNGEIDFDEFLFHMSQIDMASMYGEIPDIEAMSPEQADKQLRYSKRQRLFYSAITRFSLKDALEGIERSYLAGMRKPHVLSHFTAAERLIGLTDRQLAIQLKKMQHSVDQHDRDSPYAKPMMFVGSPKTIGTPVKLKKGGKHYKGSGDRLNGKRTSSQTGKATTQQPSIEQEVKNSLRLMATRGSVVAKLPDIHLVAEIKHTVFSENLKQKGLALQATIEEEEALQPGFTKDKPQVSNQSSKPRVAARQRRMSSLSHTRKTEKKVYEKKAGWTIPKIENLKVPLPVLKIKYKSHRPTMEDLPNIREKANQAINEYYENLRKTAVRNAWEHWDNLYADTINPKKLPENFRTVYRAYSPHKEEEAFVVCPWIPGPFRQMRPPIRHTQSQGSRYEKILKIGRNPSPLRSREYQYDQMRPNSAY